jgi:hypothetical protein
VNKRLLVIGAAGLAAGLIAVAITVGVNVGNGNYGSAAALASSDVAILREISGISGQLRKSAGVEEVSQTFRPLHLPDPSATIAIRMRPTASIADIERVRDRIAGVAFHDGFRADLLAITVTDGALTIHQATFPRHDTALASQLNVWRQLRRSTSVPITTVITDHPAPSAPALTISATSTSPTDIATILAAYSRAFASTAGLPAGPSWSIPGMEGSATLPPRSVLRLMATAATRVPISQHVGSTMSSGAYLDWTGGPHPLAIISIAYLSAAHRLADPSLHLAEASELAGVIVSSGVPGINFGYEGARNGKLVRYGFFTGECDGRFEPDNSETSDLAQLGVTTDQLDGGAAGQCLPTT